jgi:hypothetical protein
MRDASPSTPSGSPLALEKRNRARAVARFRRERDEAADLGNQIDVAGTVLRSVLRGPSRWPA